MTTPCEVEWNVKALHGSERYSFGPTEEVLPPCHACLVHVCFCRGSARVRCFPQRMEGSHRAAHRELCAEGSVSDCLAAAAATETALAAQDSSPEAEDRRRLGAISMLVQLRRGLLLRGVCGEQAHATSSSPCLLIASQSLWADATAICSLDAITGCACVSRCVGQDCLLGLWLQRQLR